MEGTPDQEDLILDRERMGALEQQISSLEAEIAGLETQVEQQQEDVVAAKERVVDVARLELENAEQALRLERLEDRLRQRPAKPIDAEPEPIRMVAELRAAAGPRMLAVPELRWIAEIIEAE